MRFIALAVSLALVIFGCNRPSTTPIYSESALTDSIDTWDGYYHIDASSVIMAHYDMDTVSVSDYIVFAPVEFDSLDWRNGTRWTKLFASYTSYHPYGWEGYTFYLMDGDSTQIIDIDKIFTGNIIISEEIKTR